MLKLNRLLLVLTVALCLLSFPVLSADEIRSESAIGDSSFDHARYAYYLSSSVANVTDIIDAFESRQLSILPIVMPDPNFIHLQDGGLLPFGPDNLPNRFTKRLIPVQQDGITVYPVTVMEMPSSGERQILNGAGDVIAEVKSPKNYDPLWYVRLRFPDLDTLDPKAAAWQTALYDPSRIMVRFNLITEDELIEKVMAESLAAQSLTMTPMALSYPATGLAFDSMSVQTNGTVDVSMSWPSEELATEGLDIFSCTDLMNQQWSILLTTNVNNAAGSFAFTAPAAGTGGKRFLDAWTHYDSDSDTLYDGRELRLYGTDRYDPDTDADGMPDGWEHNNSLDPLDDTDADGDADSDGLSNLAEYQAGTDPQESDSDGDGLFDGAEVFYGRVSHWGANDEGQASIPSNMTDVVSISAGIWHCLALRKDGTIVAWGDDQYDQVSGAAGISNVAQIVAGYYHNLAILNDGSVIAWGRNNAGQTNVPANVTNAVSVAAGDNHSLALLSDGTIVGWGNNGDDRISGGSHITNAIAIAAGDRHSLALLSDGTVEGWGWDWYDHSSGAAAISNATAVSAGHWHSTALHTDGTVSGWGYDYQGQCSGSATVQGAVSIDAGIYHSVAVRADGSVTTWGGDSYGERETPVGLGNVKQVSASGYYTLALSGPLDPLNPDNDGDGLLDGQDLTVDSSDPRYQAFAAAGIAYTDDGGQRTFKGESDAGTDPFNWQSSGSGIPDGWSVKHGFDPLDASIKTQDSDSDGVTNYLEMVYGTDPWSTDSDGDTVSDYTEIMGGSNPLDAGETSYESGGATFLLSAGYQAPTGSGTGNGIGTLQIGPLTVPFSHESPVQNLELQLPRAVMHAMSFSGATDHLGGALALSVDPQPNNMVIHDPAGLFGTPHSTACGYPSAFVAFPVVFLSDVDISISWPDDFYLVATIVPDGLHGVFNYSVPEDYYTATPASSTNGETYITADYPQCGYSYDQLTVTFVAPSNCLTTIGTLSDTAEISNSTALDIDIEPVDDPGNLLGVNQTNTYQAVLNMSVSGDYQWSVDTNYLEIVGSDTESNVTVTAIAPGQSYLALDFTPDAALSPCCTGYEISNISVDLKDDIPWINDYTVETIDSSTTPQKIALAFPSHVDDVDWWAAATIEAQLELSGAFEYKRDGTQADVSWLGQPPSPIPLQFEAGYLNRYFILTDGCGSTPVAELVTLPNSTEIVKLRNMRTSDRVVVMNPDSGAESKATIVKNFTWNDLQVIGLQALAFDAGFGNLNADLKDNIKNTIIYALSQSPNSEQSQERDAIELSYTPLASLDIPSSWGIGEFPSDFGHFHITFVGSVPQDLQQAKQAFATNYAQKVQQAGVDANTNYKEKAGRDKHEQLYSSVTADLLALLNNAANRDDVVLVYHTFEHIAVLADYVDPAGQASLQAGDPIRNINTNLSATDTQTYGSVNDPNLIYPGSDDTSNAVYSTFGLDHFLQVSFFVTKDGKIKLCLGDGTNAPPMIRALQVRDALNE